MPVLQLYSVTLVVAPEELELVQALLAAVLALRAVGKLVEVIGTSSSPILFPAAFLNSVPSLASAGGQGLPPHMRLMLAHAAGWQLSNETATSLTFRRWSYLGVQGEGVIITSQWPMGQSMPSGKPPLAHVPAAGAGMSALKRGESEMYQ